MNSDKNPKEDFFAQLNTSCEFRTFTRRQWRELALKRDRYGMQRTLLTLAEQARSAGTRADRVSLLQGAHAVLPLHGLALQELAQLMLAQNRSRFRQNSHAVSHDSGGISIEWCDVLIEALGEEPNRYTATCLALLDALRLTLQALPEEAGDNSFSARYAEALMGQIVTLGYRPNWIPERILRMTYDEWFP